MLKYIALTSIAALAACSQMESYYPNATVVTVDGVETLVRPLPNRANTYQAMPNNPTIGQLATGVDGAIFSRNVKAIEQATGCQVDVTSIANSRQHTIAATNC